MRRRRPSTWPVTLGKCLKEIGLASVEGLVSTLHQIVTPPQKGERWAPSQEKTIPEEDPTVRRGLLGISFREGTN